VVVAATAAAVVEVMVVAAEAVAVAVVAAVAGIAADVAAVETINIPTHMRAKAPVNLQRRVPAPGSRLFLCSRTERKPLRTRFRISNLLSV
jgi:hypothetical protein